MHKKVEYKGCSLYNFNGETCSIENIGRDKYGVYNDRGEGFLVNSLDTVDIVELMTTGSIDREWGTIEPV